MSPALHALVTEYGDDGPALLTAYLNHPRGGVLMTASTLIIGRLVDVSMSPDDVFAGAVGVVEDAFFIHFAWGDWRAAVHCLCLIHGVETIVFERRGQWKRWPVHRLPS